MIYIYIYIILCLYIYIYSLQNKLSSSVLNKTTNLQVNRMAINVKTCSTTGNKGVKFSHLSLLPSVYSSASSTHLPLIPFITFLSSFLLSPDE